MLLLEKMETALESSELAEMLSSVRSKTFLKESKGSIQEFFSSAKKRLGDAVPFANRSELAKLEKKIASMNRKLNKLRKEFNEL